MSAPSTTSPHTSAEIRVEIEHTRQAMDHTLDSLGELLNPLRLMHVARVGAEDMAADLVRVARSSPIALIGSAVAVGFVLGQVIGRRR